MDTESFPTINSTNFLVWIH